MKKTLVTLAALAMASVASAATTSYSFAEENFSDGVLNLGTTLGFDGVTSWTLQAEIVVGSYDYNMWGTPALVTGGSATSNDAALKLYLRNNDGVLNGQANPDDTNLEKAVNSVVFNADNDSGYFTGLRPTDVFTVTWNYDATKESEQLTISYNLLRDGWETHSGNGPVVTITEDHMDDTFSQLSTVVIGQSGWSINEVNLTTTTPDAPPVPEPTTATLSLLALAGLAARRRRK